MYRNVGGKIKTLAAIGGWIALIAGIVLAFVIGGAYENLWIGMIALVSGIVLYISTWTMYGFGQLVEDVSSLREMEEEKMSYSQEERMGEEHDDLPED